jgi:hypothetical protein
MQVKKFFLKRENNKVINGKGNFPFPIFLINEVMKNEIIRLQV